MKCRSSRSPDKMLAAPQAGIDELRAFVAVARAGSVLQAAADLGRTQPTLSARLSTLESRWRTRLFRRSARGMVLTPEGAGLLPRVEALLRDLADIERAAGLPVAPAAVLRVGAGDALGRERLPRALTRLLRAHRSLDVQLREGPRPLLLDAVRQGEIDVALLVSPDPEDAVGGVDLEFLLESEVVLLVPAGRRRRPPARIGGLEGERIVALQEGSGFRRHVERACRTAGIAFRPGVEVGNLSLVRRFVAAGLGVAPVPAVAFPSRRAGRGVRLTSLTGISAVRYMGARRTGAPLSDVVERLLDLLRTG